MPKTTKTATKTPAAAEQTKHSVPMIKPEAAVKKSVIDRFRAKATPTTKKVSKDDRPVIDIDEETQKAFIEYAAVAEVADIAGDEKKTQNKQIVDALYDRFADVLWDSKTQPSNPTIEARVNGRLEATGMFIVSTGSMIKVAMPPVKPGEPLEDALVRSLTEMGLSKSNATRLVSEEVSFVPQWSLNFTDMMRGVSKSGTITPATPVQMSAAEALFMVIQGEDAEGNALNAKKRLEMIKEISDEGWEALQRNVSDQTTYQPTLVDGSGFLDRVCGYADDREDLGKILTVFKPVCSLKSVKYAVSDSKETKNERLFEEFKDLVLEN